MQYPEQVTGQKSPSSARVLENWYDLTNGLPEGTLSSQLLAAMFVFLSDPGMLISSCGSRGRDVDVPREERAIQGGP